MTDSARHAKLHDGDVFASRYRLIQKIGEGGYSTVFRARSLATNSDVALKIVDPDFDDAMNAEILQHFYREALVTSALRHPNTVTPIDYGRTPDGVAYIVMEYLSGEAVSEALERGEPFDLERTRQILIDVLGSLKEAHERSICHSDIKASNIFLQEGNPHARVLDFGVAQIIADSDDSSQIYGTPHYVAPEVALGRSVRARSDIYSLGITAWEMLFIDLPFKGDSVKSLLRKHIKSPFPALSEEIQHSPVGRFIVRATSKSADARPTAGQAIRILQDTMYKPGDSSQRMKVPSLLLAPQDSVAAAFPRFRLPTAESSLAVREFPFIGRDAERARLAQSTLMARVTGGGVLVTGELGIGKRRLVVEAIRQAGIDDDRVLALHCQSSLTNERIDLAEIFDALVQRFDTQVSAEIRIALGEVAKHHWAAPSADPPDALIRGSVDALITLASTVGGMVFVFAGLEYADDTFVRIVIQLFDQLEQRDAQLAVLATLSTDQPFACRTAQYLLRNVRGGVWPSARRVRLEALPDDVVRHLVRSVGSVSNDVAGIVVERAGGNPAKVQGLLLSGLQSGVIIEDHGRLVLKLRGNRSEMSAFVPGVEPVERRLETIIRKEQLFGLLAAVSYLGENFTEGIVRIALKLLADALGPNCQQDLNRAIDQNILVAADSDEDTLRFLHTEIGDSLRARLPDELRQRFSRGAADVLRMNASTVHHWRQAARLYTGLGHAKAACVCALQGAELADSAGDVQSAEELFTTAYSAYGAWEIADGEARMSVRFRIELGLARTKWVQGAVGSAIEMYIELVDKSREAGNDAVELESLLDLCQIQVAGGVAETVASHMQRILPLARQSTDPAHYVRALILVGEHGRSVGKRREAAKAYVEAERRAAAGELPFWRAKARMGIARCLALEGRYDRADQLLTEAVRILRGSRSNELLIHALVEQGNMRSASGGTGSDVLFDEAIELADEQGRTAVLADILSGQATMMRTVGKSDEAMILFLRALDRYRGLGNRRGEASTLQQLAECSLDRNQMAAARTYAVEASAAFTQMQDSLGTAKSLLSLSEIQFREKRFAESAASAKDAVDQAQLVRARAEHMRALIYCGRALASSGMLPAAKAAFSQASVVAESLDDEARRLVAESAVKDWLAEALRE